jgi:hypothetical protein
MDLLPLEGVSIGGVNGLLISVDETLGHMGGASITSKSTQPLFKTVQHIIGLYNQYGHKVRHITFDGEGQAYTCPSRAHATTRWYRD